MCILESNRVLSTLNCSTPAMNSATDIKQYYKLMTAQATCQGHQFILGKVNVDPKCPREVRPQLYRRGFHFTTLKSVPIWANKLEYTHVVRVWPESEVEDSFHYKTNLDYRGFYRSFSLTK